MSGAPHDLPPHVAMMELLNGGLVARCIALAAELGIADLLADGPKDAAALAAATKTKPDPLYRVLRTLASMGIFVEQPGQRFVNSPLSETLASEGRTSVRALAMWMGHPLHWKMTGDLDYTVRTGAPAVLRDAPGKSPFEVLMADPTAQSVFNDAMTGLTTADAVAIVQGYDFARHKRIMDVGGGHGMMAMMIARAAPESSITVFDQPHVVEGARQRLAAAGLAGKVETVGGSFFEKVPGPVDLIVLKWILHDWDDEKSKRILDNCRAALAPGGRVLVCEMLIGPGPDSIPTKIVDLELMAATGGRERTEAEYAELFRGAGLKLDKVGETFTLVRLLEASVA